MADLGVRAAGPGAPTPHSVTRHRNILFFSEITYLAILLSQGTCADQKFTVGSKKERYFCTEEGTVENLITAEYPNVTSQ